uniref:Uncharacterized protein n=1 Tax=Loa loa TaxID=7209 RepID=A0A1I7VFM0_LOALO
MDKNGEVRRAQIETLYGKLLNRPINMLYPLEINDGGDFLDDDDEENIEIQSNHQKIDIPEDSSLYYWHKQWQKKIASVNGIPDIVISGIPFNIPERWNYKELQTKQNLMSV